MADDPKVPDAMRAIDRMLGIPYGQQMLPNISYNELLRLLSNPADPKWQKNFQKPRAPQLGEPTSVGLIRGYGGGTFDIFKSQMPALPGDRRKFNI